jgi:hypothetical protein
MDRHMKNRIEKCLGTLMLTFIVFTTSACQETLVHWGIDHADWMTEIWMDGYFDLTEAQEDSLEPKILSHLKWTQTEIAPIFVADLNHIKAIKRKLTREEINDYFFKRPGALKDRIFDRIAPDVSKFIGTLGPEQVLAYHQKVKEDYEEELEMTGLSSEDYDCEYLEIQEEMVDPLDDSIDDLTDDQYEKLISLSYVSQDDYKKGVIFKYKHLNEFMDRAIAINDLAARTKFIAAWAKKPSFRDADLQKKYTEFTTSRDAHDLRFWQGVEDTLTPAQRGERFGGLEDVLDYVRYFMAAEYD